MSHNKVSKILTNFISLERALKLQNTGSFQLPDRGKNLEALAFTAMASSHSSISTPTGQWSEPGTSDSIQACRTREESSEETKT